MPLRERNAQKAGGSANIMVSAVCLPNMTGVPFAMRGRVRLCLVALTFYLATPITYRTGADC